MKKYTGERLETHIFNRVAVEHLHRYSFSLPFVKNRIVLDIACGEGYGTSLISEHASFVYGVDIDEATIINAKKKYKEKNLSFQKGSTSLIPLANNSVDVVVSFETIEHHDQHEKMFEEIKRVLKEGGVLIISSPDKYYYSDVRNYSNPFHVKELYKNEFKEIVSKYFDYFKTFDQSSINENSVIVKLDIDRSLYRGNYEDIHVESFNPMFLVAICSNVHFECEDISVFSSSFIPTDEKKVKTGILFKKFSMHSIFNYSFKIFRKIIK